MQQDVPICYDCNLRLPSMQELLIHKNDCGANVSSTGRVLSAALNFN